MNHYPDRDGFDLSLHERDDMNRLGFLYETLKNDLHGGLAPDAFTLVVLGAPEAECIAGINGQYPPVGHGYPRLDEDG
ncbi:hypothetical protein ACWC09_02800 [Streptomyces sp. NPDC001617]